MPAKTEKQKKFFGAVMGAKKGQKGVKGPAKKTAKKMTKKQIKKYLKKESFNDVYRNLIEQTEGLADWEIGVEESPEYAEGEARQGYEDSSDDEFEIDSIEVLHDLHDDIKNLMRSVKYSELISNTGPLQSVFREIRDVIQDEIRDMQETSDTHRAFRDDLD